MEVTDAQFAGVITLSMPTPSWDPVIGTLGGVLLSLRDRQQAIYQFKTGLLCEPVVFIIHFHGNENPEVHFLRWGGRPHLISR